MTDFLGKLNVCLKYSIKPLCITHINKDRMGGARSTHTEQNAKAYKIFRKPGGNGPLGTNISR